MDKYNINNFNEEDSKINILKDGEVKFLPQPSTSAVKLEPLSPRLQVTIKKEPTESPKETEYVEADTCLSTQQPREFKKENHTREEIIQNVTKSSNLAAIDTIKVYIRGLVGTDTYIIKRELVALGYRPIDIYSINVGKACSFIVTLKTTSNVSEIYKLRSLLSCHIQVEPWRATKGTIQCKKCQQFWHAESNCCRRRVCPRCGGEHKPQNCPSSLQNLRCANCTGPHAASDVKCPIFKGELQRAKHVAAKAKRYLAKTNSHYPQCQPRLKSRRENNIPSTATIASSSTTIATREGCYGRLPHTHNSKVCYLMVLEMLKSVMASLPSGQEAAQQAVLMGFFQYDLWTRTSRPQ